ncbi:MAG: hypothetical protein IM504_09050 [Microcystis sp. M038S2]|jgi:hypothetical protein|uniref:hypothetical protein n=1 Tax=unclassified Microcystis TaxID=2643300 RepID=UPI001190C76D|nr:MULTISPECIES: hypothetical protein [unclassified Microcystis]NCR45037.1 hypothetical protein [Microcystis aeruginosa SX13-01]NCT62799.1 hypothetical protein [Microcystis aeruginosa G13-01]TRU56297.1 MAG: hypothetical protein EWV56_18715 [Microcystis aeruginosa Ma_QC_C_20070823_S13D]TRU59657.1 MAG: hypothetical protein EWV48_14425 [Microcystis aeruginosa Ma_QC_C_20070823_S13]MCA2684187.1 hypothetical protein [Microcystis sp. M046S2]
MNETITFRISPIIRVTLLSLYVALTIPLPFLAKVTNSPVSPNFLWVGISLGLIALYGALSERVILSETGIQVTYPQWVPAFLRSGWWLNWTDIKELKCRSTGQGGLVYYFLDRSSEKAYLLPMRVVGFNRMVKIIEEKTNLDMTDIRPLSQPWMYGILFILTLFLLLVDAWTIATARTIIP